MCLIIKAGCHIEITKKDIVTFKYVIKRKNNHWEPPCKGSELYEYNKALTARRFPFGPTDTIEHLQVINGRRETINEGFHSKVKDLSCNKICIIPKGSEICYGDDNDVVSLYIIVFKNMLSYLMYRMAKLFKRNIE